MTFNTIDVASVVVKAEPNLDSDTDENQKSPDTAQGEPNVDCNSDQDQKSPDAALEEPFLDDVDQDQTPADAASNDDEENAIQQGQTFTDAAADLNGDQAYLTQDQTSPDATNNNYCYKAKFTSRKRKASEEMSLDDHLATAAKAMKTLESIQALSIPSSCISPPLSFERSTPPPASFDKSVPPPPYFERSVTPPTCFDGGYQYYHQQMSYQCPPPPMPIFNFPPPTFNFQSFRQDMEARKSSRRQGHQVVSHSTPVKTEVENKSQKTEVGVSNSKEKEVSVSTLWKRWKADPANGWNPYELVNKMNEINKNVLENRHRLVGI